MDGKVMFRKNQPALFFKNIFNIFVNSLQSSALFSI